MVITLNKTDLKRVEKLAHKFAKHDKWTQSQHSRGLINNSIETEKDKKMTLAKALKTKNRLAQKVNNLQMEIQTENSYRKDSSKVTDVEVLMKELQEATEELIKLKIAIFVASTPMRENILRLSEQKAKINFLKSINTTEGKEGNKWAGDIEIEFAATYDKNYIKQEVLKCENSIDTLQEELDQFNHKTEIEI